MPKTKKDNPKSGKDVLKIKLVNQIAENMTCAKCNKLKAVYGDGIACLNACEGVTPFSAIVVERLDHRLIREKKLKGADPEKAKYRISPHKVKETIRRHYPDQIVGDYGFKAPEQHTRKVFKRNGP